MSLRPQICGFSIARFRSLFGTGDLEVIDRVESDWLAAQKPDANTEAYRTKFRAALCQAVHQGIPFPGLVAEEAEHVDLATLMVRCSGELPLDSGDWSHMSFHDTWEKSNIFVPDSSDMEPDSDFFRDLGFEEFGDSTQPVVRATSESGFSHILYGRPFFGREFATHRYYGYLSAEEVRYLRSRLRPIEAEEDIGDELAVQLASDLANWCDQLMTAKKDLWCCWS